MVGRGRPGCPVSGLTTGASGAKRNPSDDDSAGNRRGSIFLDRPYSGPGAPPAHRLVDKSLEGTT